jgi:hypothetical protein
MESNDPNSTGGLFSRVYLSTNELTRDSKRLRGRIGHYLSEHRSWFISSAGELRTELGVTIPFAGSAYDWARYCETCELRDLLDSITIWYRSLQSSPIYDDNARKYLEFVTRAFREERLSFRVDTSGGVHYFVDEEFERSKTSVLAGLGSPRYAGARQSLQDAFEELTSVHPDTLNAVRSAFDGVENIFKIMTKEARIGKSEIRSTLKPLLDKCGLDERALNSSRLLLDGLAEWVNAMHQYRHATGDAELSPPSIDLAVMLISSAASQARWLVNLDSSGAHR